MTCLMSQNELMRILVIRSDFCVILPESELFGNYLSERALHFHVTLYCFYLLTGPLLYILNDTIHLNVLSLCGGLIYLFHSCSPLSKLTEKLGAAFPTLPFFIAPEVRLVSFFTVRILLLTTVGR